MGLKDLTAVKDSLGQPERVRGWLSRAEGRSRDRGWLHGAGGVGSQRMV